MNFSELIATLPDVEIRGDASVSIESITDDSREVRPGSLFIAVKGTAMDGHDYCRQAIANGAVAILVQDQKAAPDDVPFAVYADTRLALARLAHRFYGDPTRALKLVAITGTNGKTTTAYLVEAILAEAGLLPGLVGTISYRFGETTRAAQNTTPGASYLAGLFAEMKQAGCHSAVIEASSHALDQQRVTGCHLDVACFTNLTRDHLDYHRTPEQYLAAKRLLFDRVLADSGKEKKSAVINIDDAQGRLLAEQLSTSELFNLVTYSASGLAEADVRLSDCRADLTGTRALARYPGGQIELSSPLVGRFNLANMAAAVACCLALGIDEEKIGRGLKALAGVPGRFERVGDGRPTVLVDYAHTGDALKRAIASVREIAAKRVITVFGCGGDRDTGKRPEMGRIAAIGGDLTIVTSDNPRTEDPQAIIDQIVPGLLKAEATQLTPDNILRNRGLKGFVVQPDRAAAIRLAIRAAGPDDVVLIAGKGHEDYQVLGNRKVHFDDREQAALAIAEIKGENR